MTSMCKEVPYDRSRVRSVRGRDEFLAAFHGGDQGGSTPCQTPIEQAVTGRPTGAPRWSGDAAHEQWCATTGATAGMGRGRHGSPAEVTAGSLRGPPARSLVDRLR